MNKEELEQAFNETTNNAVDLLKENIELKKKYTIMKENAETLAELLDKEQKKVKKVIKHIKYGAFYIDSYYGEDLRLEEVNRRYYNELLEILEEVGSDKE